MIRYRTTCGRTCQFVMCLSLFFYGCTETAKKVENMSEYYLPVGSLEGDGMRYIYRNLLDCLADREVWKHALISKDHILSINYDSRQQVVQKQYERVVYNGVIIDSLILFMPDEKGVTEIPVKVLSANRFPFDATDSTKVYLTKLEWWQPGDSLHVILERRRRFLGHTEWKWENNMVPAIRFRTEDKFETEEEGWTTSEWTGEEIYAKGIGLVYYRRNISGKLSLEFELERRE